MIRAPCSKSRILPAFRVFRVIRVAHLAYFRRFESFESFELHISRFSRESIISQQRRRENTPYYLALTDICYGWEVCAIDTDAKVLHFTNGEQYAYDRLISTMPLPEILPLVCDDETLLQDATQLEATSMALVSVGFCREIEPPALWFYVYDEDIPFARVHSPSMKSAWNAPKGKSSL